MSHQPSHITTLAFEYVKNLFATEVSDDYGYHNLEHTENVMETVVEIGLAHNLSADDIQTLELAALFHDAGYSRGHQGHEEEGARMAEAFLQANDFPQDRIDIVKQCICSTNIKIEPSNFLEEALCDADLSYLGREKFFEKVLVLRKEWEVTLGVHYNEDEWVALNVNFFRSHKYYTKYAQEHFGKVKHLHLERFLKVS